MIRAFKKALPHNYLAAELLTWQHMMPAVNSQQMGWPLLLLSDFKVIVKNHFCCGLSRCQCVVWSVICGGIQPLLLACPCVCMGKDKDIQCIPESLNRGRKTRDWGAEEKWEGVEKDDMWNLERNIIKKCMATNTHTHTRASCNTTTVRQLITSCQVKKKMLFLFSLSLQTANDIMTVKQQYFNEVDWSSSPNYFANAVTEQHRAAFCSRSMSLLLNSLLVAAALNHYSGKVCLKGILKSLLVMWQHYLAAKTCAASSALYHTAPPPPFFSLVPAGLEFKTKSKHNTPVMLVRSPWHSVVHRPNLSWPE